MANKPTPGLGARHRDPFDRIDLPGGRAPAPAAPKGAPGHDAPALPQLPGRPVGDGAVSLLLATFSPEELARLSPAELRLLAAADDELPELCDEDQRRGEQRYRARLLERATTLGLRAPKPDG